MAEKRKAKQVIVMLLALLITFAYFPASAFAGEFSFGDSLIKKILKIIKKNVAFMPWL